MYIHSVVDIVGGILLTTPDIGRIYSIHLDSTSIKPGDLFIGDDPILIEKAIHKGAFGVIHSSDIPISDKEIAWIQVSDLFDAVMRLLRFLFLSESLVVYCCHPITWKLFQETPLDQTQTIHFIDHAVMDQSNLFDLKGKKEIMLNDSGLLKTYNIEYRCLDKEHRLDHIVRHSLFETTFSYKGEYFPRLALPSLYVNAFLTAYIFLQKETDKEKLANTKFIKPYFINRYFHQVEYGKSNRFIWLNESSHLIDDELTYLKTHYTYSKRMIVSKCSDQRADYTATSFDEIKQQVLQQDARAIYVIGFSRKELEPFIKYDNLSLLLE